MEVACLSGPTKATSVVTLIAFGHEAKLYERVKLVSQYMSHEEILEEPHALLNVLFRSSM